MDLATLLVERAVVHRIPRKEAKDSEEEQAELTLSQAVTPLDDDNDRLRAYMMLRLRGSLQSAEKAFDVVFDDASESPVPDLVKNYLAAERDPTGSVESHDQALVDFSSDMARRLFEVQPAQNVKVPPSLLAVCAGTLNDEPVVAVMKLEHEQGVTVDETEIDGRRTFTMTVADDLVLTQGTKVFKAAAIGVTTGQPDGTAALDLVFDARISDSQNPFQAARVARYFTADLLGVKLSDEPHVTTERVFGAMEKFINEGIEDPAKRVAAARALSVEMLANAQTFSPTSFANKHLDTPAERSAMKQALRDNELPTTAFPKDSKLIKNRLKLMSVELDGRITVVAPEARFEDNTINIDTGNGQDQAVITIRSRLKRASSRGR